MTAVPPLTEAEARTVARFEEAPHDEASAVESVARAIFVADMGPESDPDDVANEYLTGYRSLAHAAIDAMKGPDASHTTQPTCGNLSPRIVGTASHLCELAYGHDGAHQATNVDGLPPVRWIDPTPAPAAGTGDERERLRSAIVRALTEHALSAFTGTESACACDRRWRPNREWRAHVADALLAGPLADLLAAQEAVRSYEAALRHIDRNGCENYTGTSRCLDPCSGRTRDAQYGAEAWCDPCVAADALRTEP